MGQGDFFWSFQALNSGATNSAAEGTFAVGETGSLYLYYSTMNSELDTGAGLDISLTNSGVVEFSAAETFDFDICLFGGAIASRQQLTQDGLMHLVLPKALPRIQLPD